MYEGKFDAAYPSWSKIPQSIRDMWFNELKASNVQFALKFLLFMWFDICLVVYSGCDPLSCVFRRVGVELLKNIYVMFRLYKFIYKALSLNLVQF